MKQGALIFDKESGRYDILREKAKQMNQSRQKEKNKDRGRER